MIKVYNIFFLIFLSSTFLSLQAQEPDKKDNNGAMEGMIGNIFSNANKANDAELPLAYNFDYRMTMNHWEENKKKESFTFMWTKDYAQTGTEMEGNFMVFDNEQDIILQYDNEAMQVQVLPNVMKGLGKYLKPQEEDKVKILKLEKTGRKRTIAGFECEELLVETESELSKAWVTYELRTSLQKILDNSMDIPIENYIDEKYADEFKNALALYVESTDKKKGKKHFMEVTSIDSGFTIANSKYDITE